MTQSKLHAALSAVDWKKNVDALAADPAAVKLLEDANLRLAIWAHQFELADTGNPALCFIREMQVAGQNAAVLIALALYKPAAASMRCSFETALYYSYFRSHMSELESQARGNGYYLEKKEALEFHKNHTPEFPALQQALGLISRLDKWYSHVSAVVHGQIPGSWTSHTAVSDIKPSKATQHLAIKAFTDGVDIVHRLFLCTVGRQLWDSFSSDAKKALLAGVHGDERKLLKLDKA